VRRAFRILPVWWLAVAYWAIEKGSPPEAVAAQATFFFFLRWNPTYDIVPGGWSLFVEEVFYLLLPLLFAYVQSLRRAVWLFIGALLLAFAWTAIASQFDALVTPNAFIQLFPLAMWFAFALGIVVYVLLHHPAVGADWFTHRRVSRALTVAAAVSLIAFIGIESKVLLLPTLALFLLVVASIAPRSPFGMLTRWRPLMVFGRYCCSIYLLHFIVLYELAGRLTSLPTTLRLNGAPNELCTAVVFVVVSTICFALAIFSYNLLELTFVRAGRRAVARLDRVAAPA
jgi:peptidoglycan/LPS O-acetylase OafA/YrhL